MPWVETGDELHPWQWVRDEPTEALPVVPPAATLDCESTVREPLPRPVAEPEMPSTRECPAPLPDLTSDPPASSYDSPDDLSPPQELPVSAPIETKVTAATVTAAVSGLAVWVLQTYVFRGDLPAPVDAATQVLIPALLAFAAGFFARHTPRPDLQPGTGAHALDGDPRPGQDTELPRRRLFDPDRDHG